MLWHRIHLSSEKWTNSIELEDSPLAEKDVPPNREGIWSEMEGSSWDKEEISPIMVDISLTSEVREDMFLARKWKTGRRGEMTLC